MDIAQQFKKITIFFDQNTFIAPSEQLAICSMAAVETLCVNTVDLSHYTREISIRCLHEQMIMV